MIEKKLVFHIGKPKTGTTFLQKRILNVSDCLYLGVKYQLSKIHGEVKTGELKHKRVFPAFRKNVYPSYTNFTYNSFGQMKYYAKTICDEIRKNPDATNIIVSDEAIGDYYNHMAEYNIAKVFLIGSFVKEELRDCKVSLHLSLAIRRQDNWLWSFFHHHSHFTGKFSSFIDQRVLQNDIDELGLSYSQCLEIYKKMSFGNWEIKAVPFELLSIDGKASEYLEEIFFLRKGQANVVSKSKENAKTANDTKNLSKANRYTVFGRIGYRLGEIYNPRSPSKFGYFTSKVSSAHMLVDRHLQKIIPRKYFADAPPKHISEKILNHFKESNSELQLAMKDFDLQRYGYF